jgi:excinuclease ABC subunit C
MEALLASSRARGEVRSRPIGESRTWLDMARRNASLALGQRLSAQATQEARVAALQEFLGAERRSAHRVLRRQPHDGEATVASCVVYDRGAMQISEYRRFNITGVEPGDDYGAMRQVLERATASSPTARARRPT